MDGNIDYRSNLRIDNSTCEILAESQYLMRNKNRAAPDFIKEARLELDLSEKRVSEIGGKVPVVGTSGGPKAKNREWVWPNSGKPACQVRDLEIPVVGNNISKTEGSSTIQDFKNCSGAFRLEVVGYRLQGMGSPHWPHYLHRVLSQWCLTVLQFVIL